MASVVDSSPVGDDRGQAAGDPSRVDRCRSVRPTRRAGPRRGAAHRCRARRPLVGLPRPRPSARGRCSQGAARRALLTDSRDEPWSEGERLLHRLLRSAGLTGWRTNVAVCGFRLDVAWIRFKVAVEVDGYEFHSGRETFESDRLRDQQLQAQGWAVARVTWRQLDENPENVVATVRRILRRRGWACRN
ncbi:endonuclease domain-containing protein [Propionibacterium australiense]|uniref:DUF559 domain-containing protein n=1 Tax=Propionibacterium australiense TaxID=119981 RepID=A0A8B3FLG0_9ACTN|nr:DUF559 domain-containing protein [Propionibacterium australiense]RLP08616.1 DUF559 domain-containing protein [Propionibacterium australiense]